MYKITIAVATYNRIDYVRTLSKSLAACKLIGACNIRIYDDCSPKLTLNDLEALFPEAKEIIVRDKNLGADWNMNQIYKDFLRTEDDILVVIDSDLLCNPYFIEFINDNIDRTDGMLSLYNSILHEPLYELDETFVIKAHVGSAGTVFKREIVSLIVDNEQLNFRAGYDWEWSAYLNDAGIRIFVARESMVQHIGLFGQNCNGTLTVEIGRNFKPVSIYNYEAALTAYEKTIENYRHMTLSNYDVFNDAFKKTKDYRIGRALLYPLRKIKGLYRRLR